MDQHTFLELVVLGAAIALSGYIGYAIGWEKGRTAFSVWWMETQAEGQPESTVYFGEDVHDSAQNDLYAGQRYTREQLRPMTKEELRKFTDPRGRI